MSKISYLFLVFGLLAIFYSCSETPQTESNQAAKHASILVASYKDDIINQVDLNTGTVSSLISSGINTATYSINLDLKVIGKFAYILLSDTASSIKQYDLSAGNWSGSLGSLGGYAQKLASDSSSLFVAFQSGKMVSAVSLSGLSVSGSKSMGQEAMGIFYTNGNVYACVSDGYSSYANSKIAVLAAGNITGTPTYYSVLPNPQFIASDGTGAIFVSSAGTANLITYAYNNDGGITKITGTTSVNIVTGKSFSAIQYANGKIYAAEYNNGIDIYDANGNSIAQILAGISIHSMLVYNGSLYAEGNNNIYQINLSDNSVTKTYNNVIPNDSFGSAMDVYQ